MITLFFYFLEIYDLVVKKWSKPPDKSPKLGKNVPNHLLKPNKPGKFFVTYFLQTSAYSKLPIFVTFLLSSCARLADFSSNSSTPSYESILSRLATENSALENTFS